MVPYRRSSTIQDVQPTGKRDAVEFLQFKNQKDIVIQLKTCFVNHHVYLVRACTIRYLLHSGNQDVAEQQMQWDRRHGFLWIEELVELLGLYEKERDKYPTLADFMPEIVKLQNAIVTDEYIDELRKREENRPKVTATNPPNGAQNVDPAITDISVTFDRPMASSMAWCSKDGGKTSPGRSDHTFPVWSDDGRTCTMSNVVLLPGTTYNIWLNSEGFDNFRSAEGVPLVPVHYTFTTRVETTDTDE